MKKHVHTTNNWFKLYEITVQYAYKLKLHQFIIRWDYYTS